MLEWIQSDQDLFPVDPLRDGTATVASAANETVLNSSLCHNSTSFPATRCKAAKYLGSGEAN